MIYKAIFSNLIFFLLITAGASAFAEDNKKICDQIIIGFSKDAKKSDIKVLEQKFKLQAVKEFKRIYAICYKFEDGENLDSLIKKLQEENIVRYAERNGKVSKKS
ncbi:MAG: hypothetical protein NE328_16810 [Lentisphaeraceae bacterium]|nr:hypothetical protein [Lentisphaeraceae bacterium]